VVEQETSDKKAHVEAEIAQKRWNGTQGKTTRPYTAGAGRLSNGPLIVRPYNELKHSGGTLIAGDSIILSTIVETCIININGFDPYQKFLEIDREAIQRSFFFQPTTLFIIIKNSRESSHSEYSTREGVYAQANGDESNAKAG
jgi:hypothetical protein